MTKDEALKLALDFIIATNNSSQFWLVPESNLNKTVTAIKEALAQPESDTVQRLSALVRAQQITIDKLEQALAQPEQEPVAWQFFQGGKWHNGMEFHDHRKHTIAAGTPVRDLYTHPPQRKPLTDEQILHFVDTHVGAPSMAYPLDNSDWISFAQAIEAAHGIKENT